MLLLFPLLWASAPVSIDEQAAIDVADQFVHSSRPASISCADNDIARSIGLTGWSPVCSEGTLTDVTNDVMWIELLALNQALGGNTSWRVLMEAQRERFANPRRVRETYRRLKPLVLPILETNPEDALYAKVYLLQMLIPDFTTEIPASLRELYRVEAAADEANMKARVYDPAKGTSWDPVTSAAYERANIAFGEAALAAGFHDPLALQFRMRREAEGGQPLVDAWREVFTDFARSL